jgi:hypothetical protein
MLALKWCCGSCGYREYYLGVLFVIILLRLIINYEFLTKKSIIIDKLVILLSLIYLILFIIALYKTQPVIIDTVIGNQNSQRKYIIIEPLIYASIAFSSLLPILFVIDFLIILFLYNFRLFVLGLICFIGLLNSLNVDLYLSTLKTLMNQSYTIISSIKKLLFSGAAECMTNSDVNDIPSSSRKIESLSPTVPLDAGQRIVQGTAEIVKGKSIVGLESIATDHPILRGTLQQNRDGSCILRAEQSFSHIDSDFREAVLTARDNIIGNINKEYTETRGSLIGGVSGIGAEVASRPIKDWASSPSSLDIQISASECTKLREDIYKAIRTLGREKEK